MSTIRSRDHIQLSNMSLSQVPSVARVPVPGVSFPRARLLWFCHMKPVLKDVNMFCIAFVHVFMSIAGGGMPSERSCRQLLKPGKEWHDFVYHHAIYILFQALPIKLQHRIGFG